MFSFHKPIAIIFPKDFEPTIEKIDKLGLDLDKNYTESKKLQNDAQNVPKPGRGRPSKIININNNKENKKKKRPVGMPKKDRECEQRKIETSDDIRQIIYATLTDRDLHTLGPHVWLNDTIINNYLLLCDREDTIMVSSQFIHAFLRMDVTKILRWYNADQIIRNKDQNIIRLIFFSVCYDNHWALIVINKQLNKITHYDSMGIGLKFGW